MKKPEYQIGAKWRVDRPLDPFTFTIIGEGSKPSHKLCRVEFDVQRNGSMNFEDEFSHKHLKEHAKYVGEK